MTLCDEGVCCEATTTTTITITSATTPSPKPLEKDCSEVCKDSTEPEFVPDSSCSNHYCRCQIGLGVDGYCSKGEGWCSKEETCKVDCQEDECYKPNTTTTTTTTITTTATTLPKPLEKDCSDVCKDSSDPELVPDSCCSNHYCRCQIGLGMDGYCSKGEGWCLKEGGCKAGCDEEECCGWANVRPKTPNSQHTWEADLTDIKLLTIDLIDVTLVLGHTMFMLLATILYRWWTCSCFFDQLILARWYQSWILDP